MTDTEVLRPGNIGRLTVSQAADVAPWINIMVYGHSGVGKTRLTASACEVEDMSPVLMIDVEGGTWSIRDLYPQLDVVRVKSMQDMQQVYEELRRGKTPYKTVILDSLTEIQKFSMLGIMTELVKAEPDRDPDVPGIREWGKNSEQMRRLVRAFRDLPINTIFTALAAESQNRKNQTVVRPSLSGKLASEVQGFLDIVVYMYVKQVDDENRRMILSMSTETEAAKDRSDKLPPVLESPTMKTIHQIIFEQETGETS